MLEELYGRDCVRLAQTLVRTISDLCDQVGVIQTDPFDTRPRVENFLIGFTWK